MNGYTIGRKDIFQMKVIFAEKWKQTPCFYCEADRMFTLIILLMKKTLQILSFLVI